YSNLETSTRQVLDDHKIDTSHGMTQSLCGTFARDPCNGRKKLRAKRMPRSMSDGEHLQFLTQKVGENPFDPRIPTAPLNEDQIQEMNPELKNGSHHDLPEIEEKNSGSKCSLNGMGAGEGLVDRLDGDGGSVSEAAEQSEASIWEWDDYKVLPMFQ